MVGGGFRLPTHQTMELTEPIESINKQLRDLFGIDTATGREMFRVVFSDDQREKRMTQYSDGGILLLYAEIRELPKYQWINGKYVLERLVVVPDQNREELAGLKLSYEPIWVFEHSQTKQAIPPAVWACKFVIDTLLAATGRHSMKKYVDEEELYPAEMKEKRIKEYEEILFGDESSLLLRTVTGEAIVVPQAYEKPTQQDKES